MSHDHKYIIEGITSLAVRIGREFKSVWSEIGDLKRRVSDLESRND